MSKNELMVKTYLKFCCIPFDRFLFILILFLAVSAFIFPSGASSGNLSDNILSEESMIPENTAGIDIVSIGHLFPDNNDHHEGYSPFIHWSPEGSFIILRLAKSNDSAPAKSVNHFIIGDVENKTYCSFNPGISDNDSTLLYDIFWIDEGNHLKIWGNHSGPSASHPFQAISTSDGGKIRAAGSSESASLKDIIYGKGARIISFSPDIQKYVYIDCQKSESDIYDHYLIETVDGSQRYPLFSASLSDPLSYSSPVWIDNETVFYASCQTHSSEPTLYQKRTGTRLLKKNILTGEETILFDGNESAGKDNCLCSFLRSYDAEGRVRQDVSEYNIDRISADRNAEHFLLESYVWDYSESPAVRHIIYAVLDTKTSEMTYFTPINNTDSFSCQWSPSGPQLLVSDGKTLSVISDSGKTVTDVASGNISQEQWFPDGGKIFFIESDRNLCTVNADGTDLRTIAVRGETHRSIFSSGTQAEKIVIVPDPSGSGYRIIYPSALDRDGRMFSGSTDNFGVPDVYNHSGSLFMTDENGTEIRQLTSPVIGRYDSVSDVSPSGSVLVIESRFHAEKFFDRDFFICDIGDSGFLSGWHKGPVGKTDDETPGFSDDPGISGSSRDNERKTDSGFPEKSPAVPKTIPAFTWLSVIAALFMIIRRRLTDE